MGRKRRGRGRKQGRKKYVDFVAFLPEEIWESILCRLIDETSSEDFTNCRLVCKNWNERICSNSHLWKVGCEKLGLNVKKDTDVDYKNLFLRMRKRLLKMKNGVEVFCVEEFKMQNFPSSMYYHNGIAAIGSYGGSIHLLELEPNVIVVSWVDIMYYGNAICIHFDDSNLVVGTDRGFVITFEMPTMKRLYKKKHSDGISCITFNKDMDLLIIASIRSVAFWCLSSGTVYFTQTIDIFSAIVKFQLIPSPNLQNGCDYMLLGLSYHSSCCFIFDSQQITTAKMIPFPIKNFAPSDICLVSYFRNPFFYFVSILKNSQIAILLEYDFASDVCVEKGRFNCCDMLVVGIGNKYACLLKQNLGIAQKLIMFDLATKSEVTSFNIPEHTCLRTGLRMEVNGGFLDGFGFNDNGVIMRSNDVNDTKKTYFVKWRE